MECFLPDKLISPVACLLSMSHALKQHFKRAPKSEQSTIPTLVELRIKLGIVKMSNQSKHGMAT